MNKEENPWKFRLIGTPYCVRMLRRCVVFFHPEALVRWHNTKEQFTVEEFIHANCAYPGDWEGTIKRIENIGSLLVTVTQVYTCDRSLSFHVVSFFQMENSLIMAIDEYWGDDGDAPQWRQEMHIGSRIP